MIKTDKHTLTQISFFFAALIRADLKTKMHILNIDMYTEGVISSGTLSCRVISGRQARFKNVVNPVVHCIF